MTDNGELPLDQLLGHAAFVGRHIGPDDSQIRHMLSALGLDSLDALIEATVPPSIRLAAPLPLQEPVSEPDALARLRRLAEDNDAARSLIGLGYYDTVTPPVILRNVLENPGWYTAYTPYQAEISQGRLEALLTFQQLTMDLTGMELANASLLDEATAAAEAMAMAGRISRKKGCRRFFVDAGCFPQTIDVLRTRAERFGFELIVDDRANLRRHEVFGALFQYPDAGGEAADLRDAIAHLHEEKAVAAVATDLMSLLLLTPPGEMGADIVLGSSQRFGVPMAYGGPHAAFFATRDEYKRAVPGRLIGVSRDSRGRTAYRMALQTREQHIRREKANSNICTAQVLLANVAALYAVYHGPRGLHIIASRIHRLTRILAEGLTSRGLAPSNTVFFDTLTLPATGEVRRHILERARLSRFNLRCDRPDSIGLSLDECSTPEEVELLWHVLLGEDAAGLSVDAHDQGLREGRSLTADMPDALRRRTTYLEHPVFNTHHSETEMLRYLKKLENRDFSLTHAMIPLGSCTMKLNATAEMIPMTWPAFSRPHPFAPVKQTRGYRRMIAELEEMLAALTGLDAVSMQPNSGAQGEYAGLLAIRRYLDSQGRTQRNVCLIPSSAHGTNPASAQMIGMEVVVVACDQAGNIDMDDLERKVRERGDELAALMLTYPSTHGVFEAGVRDICRLVHEQGGQVYMDGANMNALVGTASVGAIGADVCHLNLHKTFCIPHGGGGPGMGPIAVKAHLRPHLSNHALVPLDGPARDNSAVSAAPWGSPGVLPISWMYLTLMGAEGLSKATRVAILNANYIATRLAEHYRVLYTGRSGRVAHECIIDLRPLKQSTGVSDEDVAKRLMDYGFHAPTMSFPVPGTLMIEPTESEALEELDRFIEAMIGIRAEIARIERGEIAAADSPLKHAPHTLADLADAEWDRAYSREEAAFPRPWLKDNKIWPTVNRIDNVHGDRHLFCACPSPEQYESLQEE